jgi:basic membrane lipoprotein Med (substrate-binding protein (PBP1-ABC) superfamily)
MTKAVPGVKLLEAENVPEGPGVATVIQNMINQGATVIFPQSYGYQDYALEVAANDALSLGTGREVSTR